MRIHDNMSRRLSCAFILAILLIGCGRSTQANSPSWQLSTEHDMPTTQDMSPDAPADIPPDTTDRQDLSTPDLGDQSDQSDQSLEEPCLYLEDSNGHRHDDEYEIGEIFTDIKQTHDLWLVNCSRAHTAHITTVQTDHTPKVRILQNQLNLPQMLAPGARQHLILEVTSQTQHEQLRQKLIVTFADNTIREWSLRAKDIGCSPEIVAQARIINPPEEFLVKHYTSTLCIWPLLNLEFRAINTTTSDALDAHRLEWRLIRKPINSTSRLRPNNTVSQPQLFLDLTGTYEVHLTSTSRGQCTHTASVIASYGDCTGGM